MKYQCTNCGSENHKAMDCTKPKGAWTPPPELEASKAGQDAPDRVLNAETATLAAVEQAVFEPKPRWPGAPKVCTAENRMCFPDGSHVSAYLKRYAPSAQVDRTWECSKCGAVHYEGHMPAPSQDGHRTKLPKNFRPRFRDYPRSSPRSFDGLLEGAEPAKAHAKTDRTAPPLPKAKAVAKQEALF